MFHAGRSCTNSKKPGGSVTLNSSNPFDNPLIDPRFLEHPFDAYIMVKALKSAKKFLSGIAWSDYVIAPYGDFANATTDAELEAYARARTRGSVSISLFILWVTAPTRLSHLASGMLWVRLPCRHMMPRMASSIRICG